MQEPQLWHSGSYCFELLRNYDGATGIKSPGVYSTFQESLHKAAEELDDLGFVPNSPSDGSHLQLQFTVKDGMDGAGNQLKIKGQKAATMELMGYVVLEVHDVTDPAGQKAATMELMGYVVLEVHDVTDPVRANISVLMIQIPESKLTELSCRSQNTSQIVQNIRSTCSYAVNA